MGRLRDPIGRGLLFALVLATIALPMEASVGATPSPMPSVDPWTDELARIDREVRLHHPDPFAINPESAWVAKLAELGTSLPLATPDERIAQLGGLIGLLDSHSYLFGPVHLYGVWIYRFPEGWFVVKAEDPALVGSRLVAIGDTPIDEVEDALRPLIASDNESNELIGMQDLMSTVEVLHGLGVVDDTTKPGFVFEKTDGSRVTEDPAMETGDGDWAASLVGYLMGDATEAVARRTEPVWTRLDEPIRTFLISYNDYTELDLGPALQAMTAALDDGSAERVVVDMRYLRGGNGGLARPLIDALRTDDRVNRPGGLTVLIGRENSSAGTLVAGWLDRETEAILVGEPTPARADNFLCDCYDIPITLIPGFVVVVPTEYHGNGDPRDAVQPDVPYVLTAAEFFAGEDPALDLAMAGAR